MSLKTVMIVVDRVLGMTVAEDSGDSKKPVAIGESETAMMAFSIALSVAFLVMTAGVLSGDFSAEEISVVNYIANSPFSAILSNSDQAQWHPLYHASLWYWANTFRGASEAFLRLPNVLFMLAAAFIAYTSGKRLFRAPGLAWFLIGLILMSPVLINNFAWAFGYSMTIFLATIATAGALFAASGKRLQGAFLMVPSLVLMPLTIPSTITVGVTLALFLVVHFAMRGKLKMNLLYVGLVALTVGLSYFGATYALGMIFEKKAAAPTNQSYGLNVGLWLLSVLAQVGTFAAIAIVARRQKDLPALESDDETTDPRDAMNRSLPALTIIAGIVGAVAIGGFSVRPMDCLALLVPVSYGAIGCYDRRVNRVNKYFYVMMLALFGNHLTVTRVADYLMYKDVTNGRYAKNLLQRFDANSKSASSAVTTIVSSKVPTNGRVFVQPELYTQFLFYWKILGRDPDVVERLDERMELVLEKEHYRYFPLFAVGFDERLLVDRLKGALGQIMVRMVPSSPEIRIFQVLMPPPEEMMPGPLPEGMPTTPIVMESLQ